jgi:hypothetical protein
VLDLTTMCYAFRLHWEWLSRTDPDKMWAVIPTKQERVLHSMFDVSVTVELGNSTQARFWTDHWFQGTSIELSVLDLITIVSKRGLKRMLVAQALQNLQWVGDLTGSLSI